MQPRTSLEETRKDQDSLPFQYLASACSRRGLNLVMQLGLDPGVSQDRRRLETSSSCFLGTLLPASSSFHFMAPPIQEALRSALPPSNPIVTAIRSSDQRQGQQSSLRLVKGFNPSLGHTGTGHMIPSTQEFQETRDPKLTGTATES